MAYHNNNPYCGDSSVCTENRSLSGSNRDFDQAPSIHVCKSPDYGYDEGVIDSSERSFQLGVDPIERDWGDSQSVSRCHGDEAAPLGRSRHDSCDSSLPSIRTHERNANYTPRLPECDYASRGARSQRTQDTHSVTNSSIYSGPSQRGDPQDAQNGTRRAMRPSCAELRCMDHSERAKPSRPENRRSGACSTIPKTPDYDQRLSSNTSSAGSVCSRSAPLRRTRIARERAVYRPASSQHSINSRRTFAYQRDYNGISQSRRVSDYQSISPMPPVHIDVVLSQDRLPMANKDSAASVTIMVDIAPGLQAPLRGTEETYKAVAKDFYANVSCFACSLELCCIADVSYVLCPECKVISPLEGNRFEGKELTRQGLGMGFTYDSLFKMQLEIMKGRNGGRS